MAVTNIGSINAAGTSASAGSSVSASDAAEFASALSASKSTSAADLESIFEAASKKYNVPVSLLKAVARVESNFHANATSRCGAEGIMQLMPRTPKSLGVTDAYDPEQNIMGGAKYLRQMLNEFGGDTRLALAAYNAGPGTVKKYGGVPSFGEGYVNKVLGFCGTDFSSEIAKASSGTSSTPAGAQSISSVIANSSSSDTDLMSSKLLMSMYQMWLNEKMNDSQNSLIQSLSTEDRE